MFRKPQQPPDGTKAKDVLHDDNYEFAQAYLARTRRMLFLRGPIQLRPDHFGPTSIGDDIIAMNVDDPSKPIYLYISSPGGIIDTGFELFDLMRMSRAPVITIGAYAASMATVVLNAGSERLLMSNARVMLHLPSQFFKEAALDTKEMDIYSKQLERLKDRIVDCYIARGVTAGLKGGQATEPKIRRKILKDIDRELWLTADEAIDYGLADRLVETDDLLGAGDGPPA